MTLLLAAALVLGAGSAPCAPPDSLAFAAACAPGPRVTIAAVGDLLMQGPVQREAYEHAEGPEAGFRAAWAGVADLLEAADLAYANLESPTAAGITAAGTAVPDPGARLDGRVYGEFPAFNTHPSLLRALKGTGFDVVSTANNHALDRGPRGVDLTLEALRAADLAATGTREQGTAGPWHTVTEANGLRIAWLACTYGTNHPDPHGQALRCRDPGVVQTIRRLDADPAVDAVIVTPHWGLEGNAAPWPRQQGWARDFVRAGAIAVLGSHPHELQPWTRLTTPDGREAIVHYSLGNFVSAQRRLPQRTAVILFLGLTRGADGVTRIHGARYVPIHTRRTPEGLRVEAVDRVGGPADARAYAARHYGLWNRAVPVAPVVADSQCGTEAGVLDALLAATETPSGPGTVRYFDAEAFVRPRPTVEVRYTLGTDAPVRVAVYTQLGRLVRVLVDEEQPAGPHHQSWDGRAEGGERVGSGSYVVRIQAGPDRDARRVPVVW